MINNHRLKRLGMKPYPSVVEFLVKAVPANTKVQLLFFKDRPTLPIGYISEKAFVPKKRRIRKPKKLK